MPAVTAAMAMVKANTRTSRAPRERAPRPRRTERGWDMREQSSSPLRSLSALGAPLSAQPEVLLEPAGLAARDLEGRAGLIGQPHLPASWRPLLERGDLLQVHEVGAVDAEEARGGQQV